MRREPCVEVYVLYCTMTQAGSSDSYEIWKRGDRKPSVEGTALQANRGVGLPSVF